MTKLKERLRRLDWGNHLFNFLATLFGVLIAFYLANYQENRRDQKRLEVATKHIIAEIEKNLESTKNHIKKISLQSDALQIFVNYLDDKNDLIATQAQIDSFMKKFPGFYTLKDKKAINDSLYNWNGDLNLSFDFLGVSDIAWRNAQGMDVLHLMDFKTSSDLYGLYQFQTEAVTDAKKAIDILKNAMSEINTQEGKTLKEGIKQYQYQLVLARQFEEALSTYYANVLKQVKES
ncbi:MAG: hypothetical protein IPJ74_06790 [Saprospiraceae bacterium]|nr:hypothetical protein [Saprospiraceae bacterium]